MHRVIIPVDFSETSLNASRYAAKMLAAVSDAIAVLYTRCDTHEDHDICMNYQESLKKEFLKTGVKNVECIRESGGDLITNISHLAQVLEASLIVMGITGKSAIRAAMFGSNTLKLIDRNQYPVMIIPPDARYSGFRNVAFASDLKNVQETTPAALICSVLEMFDPQLHIVHISTHAQKKLSGTALTEKEKLMALFHRFSAAFHHLVMHDFYKALDQFVKEQHIDVLITIPKHQSNALSILKSTHTKRLAYHSHIPILAAHE